MHYLGIDVYPGAGLVRQLYYDHALKGAYLIGSQSHTPSAPQRFYHVVSQPLDAPIDQAYPLGPSAQDGMRVLDDG